MEAIKDAANGAWDQVREAGGAAWDAVKQAGGDAAELMRKYGAKTLKELQGILMKLPGMMLNKTGGEPEPVPSIVGTSGKIVIPKYPTEIAEGPWGDLSGGVAIEILYKVVSDPDKKSGFSFSFWKKGEAEPDEPGGKTETTGGGQKEGAGVGVQVEVKRELEDKLFGAKPSIKAGAEGTADAKGYKGKFGVGAELEWGDLIGGTSVALGGEFNILKWEPGGKPKIGVFSLVSQFKPATIEYAIDSGEFAGAKISAEVVGKVELELNPNELWFAEKLAAAAASIGTVPLAMIVGGMLSVGLPLSQIANMDNVLEGRDKAMKVGADVRRYGVDYVNALKGSYAPTQGGLAAAQWLDQLAASAGPDAVAKFMNEMNPGSAYTQAAAQAWPKIKQQTIDAYWSAHPWEKVTSLGGLIPDGGAKYLQMFLNDIEPSVMKY